MDFDEKFENIIKNYNVRSNLINLCSKLLGGLPHDTIWCKSYQVLKELETLFIDTLLEIANHYESILECEIKICDEVEKISEERKFKKLI